MFLAQFPTKMVIFTFSIEVEIKLLNKTEILPSITKLKKFQKLKKNFLPRGISVYLFVCNKKQFALLQKLQLLFNILLQCTFGCLQNIKYLPIQERT